MITLENVTKFFTVEGRKKIILDRVSLAFEAGYSYGLLGVNGAGKSTTLRLLAGVDVPNSGRIRRDVRVSWPMGLASGFHPTMSGIDNLKFVARAYGANPRDVTDFVEDFAELGDYLHAPVKTYSSGMTARLAFGLSMAIEFECYLIDEVIAVGDARFQEKCAAAFAARRDKSDIIIVSHNMPTISSMCDRCLVIVDGQLFQFGNVEEGVAMYYRLNR
jgi:capsular polysaccharide transport system ATP-binding protein